MIIGLKIQSNIKSGATDPYLECRRLGGSESFCAQLGNNLDMMAPPLPPSNGGGYQPDYGQLPSGISYTIRPGENLFRIGLRYGIPYQDLARINGISNPHQISAGQTIYIPYR